MAGFDVIGDIHGHADALEALLARLGYEKEQGVYRHPERTAIFVGDFIDRGHQQERVLRLVRGMCETGSARAVMGNHEYNAVCFATEDPVRRGEHLRPHTDKNLSQHRRFLEQMQALETWSEAHREWVAWFRTLPLWLEHEGLRVIHACWHPPSQAVLAPYLDGANRLSHDGFVATAQRDTPEYEALETLLKGQEVGLPAGYSFLDKDDYRREHVRVRWWDDPPLTYSGGAVIEDFIREDLPHLQMPILPGMGYAGDKPVFVGHYWLKGTPAPLSPQVACVDYSVADGGTLCAYRWDGEPALRAEKFVWAGGGR